MFKIVMAIMIAITIVACTKFGKNITVKGRVLNPITSEGYEGITVELIRSDHSDYAGGYKGLKHTTTNQNGEFEISAYHAGKVWIQAQTPIEYYELGWLYDKEGKYYSMKIVDKGKVMHIDCHLVPHGNVEMNIKNINCGGGADTMYFRKKWLVTEKEDAYWSTPRIGCYEYHSEPFELPMGTYVYETKVIRSGATSYVYDTLVVNKTGISVLNIEY
ncbi:MAG TPA: hypothetical protein PLP27_09995 [Crocinitomicaceae bacterium]|nr:hypothetical protein [Crocinitomicaceae bacterium]